MDNYFEDKILYKLCYSETGSVLKSREIGVFSDLSEIRDERANKESEDSKGRFFIVKETTRRTLFEN